MILLYPTEMTITLHKCPLTA